MIKDDDIEEMFIRSSGPGGQNVNKVASCVCLRHRLTGLIVKCQEFRTQYQNRVRARELLAMALDRRSRKKEQAVRSEREKKRRQSRGRSRMGQALVLEAKKRASRKKRARASVRHQD